MNITDIDDKIIKRARQNHLYENYLAENHSLDKILSDAKSVMQTCENTIKNTTDPDKRTMHEKMLISVKETIEELLVAVKSNDQAKIQECQGVRIFCIAPRYELN